MEGGRSNKASADGVKPNLCAWTETKKQKIYFKKGNPL